ncbi:MAG: hypothetical protein V9F00_05590 [Nocardioides sp.]
MVAVEDQPGNPEDVVEGTLEHQRVDYRRQVGDHRGVGHVAEVDDAGDQSGVTDQGVVDVEVAVHHLLAQAVPSRGDLLVVARQRLFGGGTHVGPPDVGDHLLDHRHRMRDPTGWSGGRWGG